MGKATTFEQIKIGFKKSLNQRKNDFARILHWNQLKFISMAQIN